MKINRCVHLKNLIVCTTQWNADWLFCRLPIDRDECVCARFFLTSNSTEMMILINLSSTLFQLRLNDRWNRFRLPMYLCVCVRSAKRKHIERRHKVVETSRRLSYTTQRRSKGEIHSFEIVQLQISLVCGGKKRKLNWFFLFFRLFASKFFRCFLFF